MVRVRSLWQTLRAVAVAAVAALALGNAAHAAMPADGGDDYRLGTGDKVRVIVYGEEDLGGEYQIDATGFVRLPLVGQVKAGGLTAHDLEGNIVAALANGYLNDPHVNVEVTTYRPFYIVGQVQKPGEYPYANGMTAASAVALAGGFTPKAVQSVIYVRHQGDSTELRLAADDATSIRPGDVVRVDSTTFWDVMDVIAPLAGVGALAGSVH